MGQYERRAFELKWMDLRVVLKGLLTDWLMDCKVGEEEDSRVTNRPPPRPPALSKWVCDGAISRNGKDGRLELAKSFFRGGEVYYPPSRLFS